MAKEIALNIRLRQRTVSLALQDQNIRQINQGLLVAKSTVACF